MSYGLTKDQVRATVFERVRQGNAIDRIPALEGRGRGGKTIFDVLLQMAEQNIVWGAKGLPFTRKFIRSVPVPGALQVAHLDIAPESNTRGQITMPEDYSYMASLVVIYGSNGEKRVTLQNVDINAGNSFLSFSPGEPSYYHHLSERDLQVSPFISEDQAVTAVGNDKVRLEIVYHTGLTEEESLLNPSGNPTWLSRNQPSLLVAMTTLVAMEHLLINAETLQPYRDNVRMHMQRLREYGYAVRSDAWASPIGGGGPPAAAAPPAAVQ